MTLQYARLLNSPTAGQTYPEVPQHFDFNDPEKSAKAILGAMARAAGQPLTSCKLLVNSPRRSATMVGRGVHVAYRDRTLASMSYEAAKLAVANNDLQILSLGTIQP